MIYGVGDRVVTKKCHPCGGDLWIILRTGADIKIKCEKCGHMVMLDLTAFKKSVKRHLPQNKEPD